LSISSNMRRIGKSFKNYVPDSLTRNSSKKRYKSEEFIKQKLEQTRKEMEMKRIQKREEIKARMSKAKEVRKVKSKLSPVVKKFLGKFY
jgi:hypothetical protein